MKSFCKHCKVSHKIEKIKEVPPFGVLYSLTCEHQMVVSKEFHKLKERQSQTLLARFLNWCSRENCEQEKEVKENG